MAAFRSLRLALAPMRRGVHTPSASDVLAADCSHVIDFGDQEVLAGAKSLSQLAQRLQALGKTKPLVVRQSITNVESLNMVLDAFTEASLTPTVFENVQTNPTWENARDITSEFSNSDADCIVAIGGGGATDAAKAAAAAVAESHTNSSFNPSTDFASFLSDAASKFQSLDANTEFAEAVPVLCTVPITAGFGGNSVGSATILNAEGTEVNFTHESLIPKFAALAPELVANESRDSIRDAGLQTLSNCFETYMVPNNTILFDDAITNDEIERCDNFAHAGIELILKNLEVSMEEPANLQAHLNMQIASLYKDRASHKGDLGSVQSTALALSSKYNIPLSNAIGRMFFPVLIHNECHPLLPEDGQQKYGQLRDLFHAQRPRMDFPTISFAVSSYLSGLGATHGIQDLDDNLGATAPDDAREAECLALANIAAAQGNQTNVVPLCPEDYQRIFTVAADISYSVL